MVHWRIRGIFSPMNFILGRSVSPPQFKSRHGFFFLVADKMKEGFCKFVFSLQDQKDNKSNILSTTARRYFFAFHGQMWRASFLLRTTWERAGYSVARQSKSLLHKQILSTSGRSFATAVSEKPVPKSPISETDIAEWEKVVRRSEKEAVAVCNDISIHLDALANCKFTQS